MEKINDFKIIRATNSHISSILNLMEKLSREFPEKFFVPSTKEELNYAISEQGGFILLCINNHDLVGGTIVMYPTEEIHYLTGHSLFESAIIDSIFVSPEYRGHRIASLLLERALQLIKRKYVYASVALDNFASQKLFFKHGFNVYEQKKLYNDHDRYVLLLERNNHAL
ncbi:MAG: GNAT family N-acetyltransferase [Erysipelotrichaceae bacterium]|nr:GNAT family N-acetyltransferase [Erysipelotrichaceae bacterium]